MFILLQTFFPAFLVHFVLSGRAEGKELDVVIIFFACLCMFIREMFLAFTICLELHSFHNMSRLAHLFILASLFTCVSCEK